MSRYIYKTVGDKVQLEHILVWEKATGKKFPGKGYAIHHINGDGHDNRPENLRLMTNSEHVALHHQMHRDGIDPVDPTDPNVIAHREKRKKYYQNNKEKALAASRKYNEDNREAVLKRKHEYYERHKEEYAEKKRAYREANREKVAAADRLYRETHREQRAEYNRKYEAEHREEVSEYHRKKYQANKEHILEQHRVYRETHREERRAYNQRYKQERIELIRAKGRLYAATRRGADPALIARFQAEVNALTAQQQLKTKKGITYQHGSLV